MAGPASDPWIPRKVEAAIHDSLAHGDLSDTKFLQKTLGLTLVANLWENELSGAPLAAPAAIQHGNEFNIGYKLVGTCIGTFSLDQITHR